MNNKVLKTHTIAQLNDQPVAAQEEEQSSQQEETVSLVDVINSQKQYNAVHMFGDIDEEAASDIIFSLMALSSTSGTEVYDKYGNFVETKKEAINFHISTHGGAAAEMFAIYDAMRTVMQTTEISTVGMGKVMSAGVLILAAGTKGKRLMGKNCRLMLHSVVANQHGPLYDIENEIEEMKWVQKRYIQCLSHETNLSKKDLRNILNKRVNIYLTAEQALKMGFVDKVV